MTAIARSSHLRHCIHRASHRKRSVPILKHRVTFETQDLTHDEQGYITTEWQTLLTTWARVDFSRSSSCVILEQQHNFLEYSVVVRFSELIGIGQRITFQDKNLTVAKFNCLDREGKYLNIIAKERI